MKPRIQQLDPHVVNRIAAGEVIERPASVVKELLENSVDALATRVEVDIVDGGMQLIRISDDGEGIHPDDLLLAVTSHATSKIRSDADLNHVHSLGFRGEALASIASVSSFRIRTRQDDAFTGHELESGGGQIIGMRECGCPVGTVMEVRNLFFNTPARRRFLKKGSTEFGHISEYFARIALANPTMHLVLRHNEKLVYELPGSTLQIDRIRRFFGSEVADKLIAVHSESPLPDGRMIRLWGFVGEPSLSKSTRRNQYLFLNGRCIQDRSLQHALEEAYRGLLMVGRHPVSFLFLEMPPALVDVNVHPTKSEVRFQDSQLLYRLLLQMLRDKFLSLELRSGFEAARSVSRALLQPPGPRTPNPRDSRELDLWASSNPLEALPRISPAAESTAVIAGTSHTVGTSHIAGTSHISLASVSASLTERLVPRSSPVEHLREPVGNPAATTGAAVLMPPVECDRPDAAVIGRMPGAAAPGSAAAARPAPVPVADTAFVTDRPGPADGPDDRSVPGPADSLTSGLSDLPVFQIHDCYLVVAGELGLEVIDQHALHERILYEHLRRRVLEGAVERQALLIPDPIECSAAEAAVLTEHQELLQEIGFELEEFGGTTILLTAYPVLIPRGDLVGTLRDFAEQLEQSGGRATRRDLLDRMLHTMACRAAIKAGQRLTREEMQELLRQRHLVDDSHHCPHGRPTSLVLSRGVLDQQFGRLG